MDDNELANRLTEGVGGPELWRLRRNTAYATGRNFEAVGELLEAAADPKDEVYKQIFAVSMLLRMAGELTTASARMLSTGQYYAGAALLRQIVEIEYLTRTFKEKYRDPEKWLDSTFEERMATFTPAQLRRTAQGRFLSKDYCDHCEQGGHPVPKGIVLLGGSNRGAAQVLLVDLITHCWRTLDQVGQWSKDVPAAQPILALAARKMWGPLKQWGDVDPIYALMVEKHPNPDLKAKL